MTTNTTKKAAGANTNGLHTDTNGSNSLPGEAINQASTYSKTRSVGISGIQRSTAVKAMTDALVCFRTTQGKVTKPIHFINEHSLCSWVLVGHYDGIDCDSLDDFSMSRLNEIRTMNAALIAMGQARHARSIALREAFPLTLPGGDDVSA